jgi:hypothetical protein
VIVILTADLLCIYESQLLADIFAFF